MRPLRISEDVVPIGQFKAEAADWLRRIQQTRQPIVITQNGRPAGVLLAPAEFDALQDRQRFIDSIEAGLRDAEAGRLLSTTAVRKRLRPRRAR